MTIEVLGVESLESVFNIVSLCQKHLTSIAQLNWSRGSLEEIFKLGSGLGMRSPEGELLGFVLYLKLDDRPVNKYKDEALVILPHIEIACLATLPEHQGKGVMSLLLNHLKLKSREVWLEVHEDNLKAIEFYKSKEFQQVGIRKRYYFDGKNAILFSFASKELDRSSL